MSSGKKKRARGCGETRVVAENREVDSDGGREGESGEEEGGDSDEGSSDFDPEMEVNVQFEVLPISDENSPAIRHLLRQLLLKGSVDVSGLSDIIVSQDGVGSMIQVDSELGGGDGCGDEGEGEGEGEGGGRLEKEQGTESGGQEEREEEVCGVVSVINLSHNRLNAAVQSLTDHLLAECKKHSPSSHPHLSRLLQYETPPNHDQHDVGLLINERYLNVPPHIVPPLLRTLLCRYCTSSEARVCYRHLHPEDFLWFGRNEIKEASRKGLPYNIESYILLARSYVLPSPLSSPRSKRGRRSEGEGETGGERGNGAQSTSVLHCQEYELLQEESVLTFSYPVNGEGWGCGGDSGFGGEWGFEDDSLQQTRTVMVIPASRLQSAITRLSSALS